MNPMLLSRRYFLTGAALATSNLYCGRALAAAADCSPLVRIRTGLLRGECLAEWRVFRGVPYAAPPVGALRFRGPSKLQSWSGERDATRFAASPMQAGEPGIEHSEDCLYLNLWVPDGKGPFPVYVWIHGGGFVSGHSFEPMYDGSGLAKEGIVCVTVGYRLGVFGFLDLEPVLGAAYAGSANNGLRDIIAALEWVRENIADFNGDPGRVTIGGESAGAKLTDILMGVRSADHLFQQMISESGGAERVWPKSAAEAICESFARQWRTQSGRDNRALTTVDGMSLIQTQHSFMDEWPQHFPLRPEVDGVLLSQLPVRTIAEGSTRGKRLLIGTNRDESALFVGPHPEHDATAAQLGNMTQARFAPIYAKYAEVYPELSVEQRRIRALTAEEYWVPSIRVADAHREGGGKTLMYRLDFTETKGRLNHYAYHSLDVGLVWDRPHIEIGNDAQEAALAKQMHFAWSAFICGGSPATAGLPKWPDYTTDARLTMILDEQSRIEKMPQEAELRLWDGVL